LDLPTASPGIRVLARLVDIAVTVFAFYVLFLVIGSITVALGGLGATAAYVLGGFALVGALLVYPAALETFWGGKTVGKALFGLRVVKADGGPAGFLDAAVRAALGLLEVWGTLGSLGFLTMLASRRGQRLGDMVAGTLVLRQRRGGSWFPVQLFVPPGCEQLVTSMDVGGMSADDYDLVRAFLVRWREFSEHQRPVVAANLAAPLWRRFRHPLPAGLGPDYYLACLGAAYQYRHHQAGSVPTAAANPWAGPGPARVTNSWAGPGPSLVAGRSTGAAGHEAGGYDAAGYDAGGYQEPSGWQPPG
jgi:uncharacterized RDD family membrane protein YckC